MQRNKEEFVTVKPQNKKPPSYAIRPYGSSDIQKFIKLFTPGSRPTKISNLKKKISSSFFSTLQIAINHVK